MNSQQLFAGELARNHADAWLLSKYSPLTGLFDEVVTPQGQIRDKYKFLINSLNELGPAGLEQRRQESLRILKENGVTYNVYSELDSQERLWSLDLLPLLLESEEFSRIERGLMQRAELLNALLKDMYGEQKFLKQRIIPHQVFFSSGGFLRPCYGLFGRVERELIFFATDLARRRDGSFVALGDRVQAPSGSGYSLENRIVLSRIFPSIYRDSQVHRVALYFRNLRKTLVNLARPAQGREPLIVVLTPGPGNETYFEHVFLSSYLGYALVQSTDLTVRKNKVFLKTVEGHQQVDVILRRTDDIYLDPLELKGDSLLGIPGILDAVRSQNIVISNPLGSAVLENRSYMAYFNDLCRFYFGEDLILPNARTYWLGDEKHKNEALADIDNLILKPAGKDPGGKLMYWATMNETDRASLMVELRAHPEKYIAQEIITGSSCPVLGADNSVTSARNVIRLFQVASETGFQVMPGGLARVSTEISELVVTNQSGAASKDIWILASEPQKEITLIKSGADTMKISRKAAGGVPSRVADNIFWMGRYAERAENLSRLLRNVISKITQAEDSWDFEDNAKLLKMLTHITGEYPGFTGDDSEENLRRPEREIHRLIYGAEFQGSVKYSLRGLVKASRNVRERLSDDMRKVIGELDSEPFESIVYSVQHAWLFDIIIYLSSLSGLTHESMSRESGWYFLELGRRIERTIFTVRVLKSFLTLDNFHDKFVFENLLNINDIRITYMRRYRHRIEAQSVLDILLFDESNPRSVGYQIGKIRDAVAQLPARRDNTRPAEEKIALKMYTHYRINDIKTLFADKNPARSLGVWLDELNQLISELNLSMTETYFNYLEEQSQIGEMNG